MRESGHRLPWILTRRRKRTSTDTSALLARSAEGERLFEQGQFVDALAAFQECAETYRELLRVDRRRFELHLAGELNNAGMCLAKLRRYPAAAAVFDEAASLIRPYREQDARLSPMLAGPLASLAGVLGELGQYDRSMALTAEVLALRLESIADEDKADPDVAQALRAFAHVRLLAGRELDRALAAATQAEQLYVLLARARPDAYEGELHDTRTILAALHAH